MVNGDIMILKLNVYMFKKWRLCSDYGSQPLFFVNGRKDKSVYFKVEYLVTDSDNGRTP